MGLDFMEHGATYERAISATGFGKFHYLLLTACGLVYANTAVGVTIVSFVLPAAQCDFRMTSADKGILAAAPMSGMVLGSFFWGCLADTKGRKTVLVISLLLDGIVGVLSSGVQHFYIFIACRIINGFACAGSTGSCFAYLGEFQTTKYREKVLCWLEIFWTLGVIILPLMAWLVIPLKGIRFESAWLVLDSWNVFVCVCSLPSIVLGLWLMSFPESPKFILECGDHEEALLVLKDIYRRNTNEDPKNFPIQSLQEKERKLSVVSLGSTRSVRSLSMRKPKDLKILLIEIQDQVKQLCRPPHRKNTLLTCTILFGVTTSYYTLMLWFPELFNRFSDFEAAFPGESVSVCTVTSPLLSAEIDHDPYCGVPVDPHIYVHTLIVGLSCIPTSLILPLCVRRVGAKSILIFSVLVAGAVTVGLFFVHSALQNLILSCIFESLTSLAVGVVYCILVDLFPTNLRVMAAALAVTSGRGGGLLGNLTFGYLIDLNCAVPILLFSAMLIGSGFLCFLIPETGRKSLE